MNLRFPSALILLLFFFLCSFIVEAQKTVSVRVLEAKQQPIIGAVVSVREIGNEITRNFITDEIGKVLFDVSMKSYSISIQSLGFKDTLFTVDFSKNAAASYTILLKESSELLQNIDITARAEAQTLKGDTTLLNAAAFTVADDASTGDLLKKMPGITIEGGTVQAQGEDVAKVFVDGKPFFGEDSKAALDLIPAEMVESVKVYDRLSDQARFKGINDGNTQKTLDIITKKDKRFGVFGKLLAGAGTNDSYQADANVNLFRNKERISLLISADNVNGSGSGLGQFVSQSRRSMGGVTTGTGIQESYSFGLNYNNSYSNGIQLQASYSLNGRDVNEGAELQRAYILPSDSGQIYSENNTSWSNSQSHLVNLDLEWQIDSSHAIEFNPNFRISNTRTQSRAVSNTSASDFILNENNRLSSSAISSLSFGGTFLYKYKFKTPRRTLSLFSSSDYDNSETESTLEALSFFANRNPAFDTTNQSALTNFNSPAFSINADYTEPLGKNGILEFSYGSDFDVQNEDRRTYNLGATDFQQLDTLLSNVFESRYNRQQYSLGYNLEITSWSFTARIANQNIVLDNLQTLPRSFDNIRNFNAVLPLLSFEYEKEKKLSVRFRYRTSTQVPSINQLQEVVNNSNPLQLSAGNPNLVQAYDQDFSVRFRLNDPRNGNGFFMYAAVNLTQDYIGQSTLISTVSNPISGLEPGMQLRRPENLDGFLSARSYFSYGFPIAEGKWMLNIRGGGSYSETPSLLNDEINLAKSLNPMIGVGISSNLSKKVDLVMNSRISGGNIQNSLNSNADNSFSTIYTNLGAKWRPDFGLSLETNLDHTYNSGLGDGFNQNFMVWSAGIGYRFLKQKRMEAKIWVFDILGQNNSVSRTFNDIYTEDRRDVVLERYLMFTLTYRINEFKGSGSSEGGGRGGRGGRPPHG
jgi:hypothetical protein